MAEADETEELIEKGSISTSVYLEYIKAGGSVLVFVLFFMLLLAQGITNASDIWLTYWYVCIVHLIIHSYFFLVFCWCFIQILRD